MAEEAKATEAQQAKQEGVQRSPSELGAEIIADEQTVSLKETHDFGGLFSDEARSSEAELEGKEEPTKEETPSDVKEEAKDKPKDDSQAAPPKPEGEQPEKKPDEKAKEEIKEKPKEEAKKKEDKPPEGFVRKEALSEARTKLRVANDEIASLRTQLATKPAVQPQADEGKWKDFKVLSDAEYDQLVEDDPIEAQKYSHRFLQYQRVQDQKKQAEVETEQSKAKMKSLVDQTVSKIREAIPGIYDEDSEVASQLAEFAVEHGFEDDAYLDAMTNPATLIVPPGQDKSYLLGPGAASLIKLINNLRAKTADASDPAKLREEITKELEPKLREQITTELVAKFKGAGKESFKSLTEVPGSGDKPGKAGPVTEEEWAKLSPEERERRLQA